MTPDTIMVVEDDADDLLLIQRALRKARIENPLAVARDGAAALDILFGEAGSEPALPLLLLLDVKLPLVDGLEVLTRVRANERTRSLPVVILTSSDQQEDLLKSYEIGVNSYVRKPIESVSFQETVGKLGLYWVLINRTPWPK